jgi:hypothetical protein
MTDALASFALQSIHITKHTHTHIISCIRPISDIYAMQRSSAGAPSLTVALHANKISALAKGRLTDGGPRLSGFNGNSSASRQTGSPVASVERGSRQHVPGNGLLVAAGGRADCTPAVKFVRL